MMNIDPKALIDDGFTLFFAVMMVVMIWMFLKKLPSTIQSIVEVWTHFNAAIEKNTEITERHYVQSSSVVTELKSVRRMLESHDANAVEIKANQEEILTILKDIESKVKS